MKFAQNAKSIKQNNDESKSQQSIYLHQQKLRQIAEMQKLLKFQKGFGKSSGINPNNIKMSELEPDSFLRKLNTGNMDTENDESSDDGDLTQIEVLLLSRKSGK
jgi:hypothetical protein